LARQFFGIFAPCIIMNILFHTYWYPYKGSIDGVFVKEHAESCRVAGNNVAVQAIKVLKGKGILSVTTEFEEKNGIPTYYLVIQSVFWKWIYINIPLLYIYTRWHYTKHIAPKFTPGVVVSNVINPAGITGHWLARKLKAKHVIVEHWTRVANFMQRNIFASTAKNAYTKASAVISVSNYLKQITIKYGALPAKAHIIPNVIDADRFFYKPKNQSGKLVFCCVTNLKYPKDPFLVIAALDRIAKKTGKVIVLNIVGDGDYRARIESLKPTLSFELNLLGYLPKDKVADVFHAADYFLHASYLETFSLVVAEAICCGTPVIASNIPPLDDLVTAETGILSENTIDAWIASIEKAMVIQYNMEKSSILYRKKYSKEGVGTMFNNLFINLTSSKTH
jgi:glycosyltransferase involved in cell wall biosynthesis